MRATKGMTLIEMVITIAIISILTVVGYTAYDRHKLKTMRTDAVRSLYKAAQELQQCHTDQGGYIKTDNSDCPHITNSIDGSYTISSAINLNTYTLTATPKAGKSVDSDGECTTFTLNHLNQKGITGSGTVKRCWTQ